MNRLIRAWMCALALVLLLPGLAAAQATVANTLPTNIYLPGGNQKVQTVPVYLVAVDTATGLPCLIGTTATCKLSVDATVTASATIANFVPGVPAGLAVNTTSARVAFTGGTTQVLENDGTSPLYYLPGNSSVVVTTTSGFLLSPGGKIAIDRGSNTHIAAITATGTAHLALSGGTGFVAMSGGGSGSGGGTSDATAANQVTGNNSLASIDTKLSSESTAANQTAVQANAGSDASKGTAVQGITGGKAVATSSAPFKQSGNVSLSPATTSSTAALGSTTTNNVLLVPNNLTVTVYGKVGATAVTTDFAVPPGMICSFDISGATQFSTITVSGSGSITAWQGTGGQPGCVPYADLLADSGTNLKSLNGNTIPSGPGNPTSGTPRFTPGFQGATQYTFSTTTAETIEVIPANGSLTTYVLFDKLQVDGTVGFTWKYGTGTNCVTGTTTLEGPYNLTAQAGWVEGNGGAPVMIVPSGKALCRTTDAGTTRTSGKVLALQF